MSSGDVRILRRQRVRYTARARRQEQEQGCRRWWRRLMCCRRRRQRTIQEQFEDIIANQLGPARQNQNEFDHQTHDRHSLDSKGNPVKPRLTRHSAEASRRRKQSLEARDENQQERTDGASEEVDTSRQGQSIRELQAESLVRKPGADRVEMKLDNDTGEVVSNETLTEKQLIIPSEYIKSTADNLCQGYSLETKDDDWEILDAFKCEESRDYQLTNSNLSLENPFKTIPKTKDKKGEPLEQKLFQTEQAVISGDGKSLSYCKSVDPNSHLRKTRHKTNAGGEIKREDTRTKDPNFMRLQGTVIEFATPSKIVKEKARQSDSEIILTCLLGCSIERSSRSLRASVEGKINDNSFVDKRRSGTPSTSSSVYLGSPEKASKPVERTAKQYTPSKSSIPASRTSGNFPKKTFELFDNETSTSMCGRSVSESLDRPLKSVEMIAEPIQKGGSASGTSTYFPDPAPLDQVEQFPGIAMLANGIRSGEDSRSSVPHCIENDVNCVELLIPKSINGTSSSVSDMSIKKSPILSTTQVATNDSNPILCPCLKNEVDGNQTEAPPIGDAVVKQNLYDDMVYKYMVWFDWKTHLMYDTPFNQRAEADSPVWDISPGPPTMGFYSYFGEQAYHLPFPKVEGNLKKKSRPMFVEKFGSYM